MLTIIFPNFFTPIHIFLIFSFESLMSLNYIKDPASQVPTLSTGSSGVDSIVRYYQNGTEEVKNLLKNECCVIYECR